MNAGCELAERTQIRAFRAGEYVLIVAEGELPTPGFEFAHTVSGPAARPCPPGADEATGFSRRLSFDEAFANALASLPPSDAILADALARVEIGGLFGGFAGFRHLFVRVCRTIT